MQSLPIKKVVKQKKLDEFEINRQLFQTARQSQPKYSSARVQKTN
jgi:hypothetical protein